jgi:hypothetical protein
MTDNWGKNHWYTKKKNQKKNLSSDFMKNKREHRVLQKMKQNFFEKKV